LEALDVRISAVPNPTYCQINLVATNTSSRPITLEFSSAQKYDFYVKSDNQRIVWKWSNNMVFANVQTKVTIHRLEQLTHSVKWDYTRNDGFPAKAGKYTVMGPVACMPQNVYSKPLPIQVPERESQAAPAKRLIKGQITHMRSGVYLLGDDGIAYRIENGDVFRRMDGKRVVAENPTVRPIPGTVDRSITIEKYQIEK